MPFAVRSCSASDVDDVLTVRESGGPHNRHPIARRIAVVDGVPHVAGSVDTNQDVVPATLETYERQAAWMLSGEQRPHGAPIDSLWSWNAVSTLTPGLEGRTWTPDRIHEIWSTNRSEVLVLAKRIADELLLVDGHLHTASFEPVLHADEWIRLSFVDRNRWKSRTDAIGFQLRDTKLFASMSQASALTEATGTRLPEDLDPKLADLPWRFPWRTATMDASAGSLASSVASGRRMEPLRINPMLRRELTAAAHLVQDDLRAAVEGIAIDEDRLLANGDRLSHLACRCGDLKRSGDKVLDVLALVERLHGMAHSPLPGRDEHAVYRL